MAGRAVVVEIIVEIAVVVELIVVEVGLSVLGFGVVVIVEIGLIVGEISGVDVVVVELIVGVIEVVGAEFGLVQVIVVDIIVVEVDIELLGVVRVGQVVIDIIVEIVVGEFCFGLVGVVIDVVAGFVVGIGGVVDVEFDIGGFERIVHRVVEVLVREEFIERVVGISGRQIVLGFAHCRQSRCLPGRRAGTSARRFRCRIRVRCWRERWP
ncbi:hypothetical protein [Ilumatobacter coccineus]|uniref:Uncharacterized protein n=1 Tax=Ilumatobacter coccineus (strain NBRC 103263 / KCTC 29153 / YM16-304) TaxID=1313172 RepID=A0A6C7DZT1_ILUCY|nr:hypothetical protein [Ilumatobacter coccineus]BAN00323.1 hypothetical protein YM304_00090 [Ilumatobacter coccineus YM16-304]